MNIIKARGLYKIINDLYAEVLGSALLRGVVLRSLITYLFFNAGKAALPHLLSLRAECVVIAKKVSTSWWAIFAMQYLYDIMQRRVGTASACTVGSRGPLFIRYLDWGVPENLGEFTEKTEKTTPTGHKYTSVGFSGFFGVVTAYAKGWAVAMNQSPVAGWDKSGVPTGLYVKLFVEAFAAAPKEKPMPFGPVARRPLLTVIEEVLNHLQEDDIKPMSSCILVVRDAIEHGVLEFLPNKKVGMVVLPVSQPLAVTNHLITGLYDEYNPEDEDELEADDDVFNDTFVRQRAMLSELERVRARKPKLDAWVDRIPGPINNELTAYVVAIDFTSGVSVVRADA